MTHDSFTHDGGGAAPTRPAPTDAELLATIAAIAPSRMRNVDAAVARHGALAARYAEALVSGDPLADAVVADLRRHVGASRHDVESALAHGIDAIRDPSPALQALCSAIDDVPDWVDFDLADAGGTALLSLGRALPVCFTAALAAGYQSAASVKPLAHTRRFIDLAERRAYETSVWFFTTVRPGGMRPGGAGRLATLRVRLVHAMVRATLASDPTWDHGAWGHPLNQADTARGIAGEFTVVPIDAARTLGYRFSDDEAHAVHHLFRYVGHLLGVDEDLLPADAAAARQYVDLVNLTNDGPDDDCRELVAALLGIGRDIELAKGHRWRGALTRELSHGYVRAFSPAGIADQLAIRRTPLRFVPAALRPAVFAHDLRRRRSVPTRARAAACAFADTTLAGLAVTDIVGLDHAGRRV